MTTPQPGKPARTDDDEWDIVSSVGYTALVVTAWRALHAGHRHPLVSDGYAEPFVRASADPHLTGLLETPATTGNSTVFPHLYGVQTRFFDEFFDEAARRGIRQAVIVAAGLDSRAYRLDWPADTTVFEVDQPRVLEFKSRVLAAQGAQPNCARTEIPADLRDDWTAPLRAAGFDPAEPSAWILEGLLPYLPGPAQDTLFARIGALSAPTSRMAIGALGTGSDWDQLAALEEAHPGLRSSSDVDFSALTYSPDTKSEPAGWLAEHGWNVDPVLTSPELQTRFGRTPADVDVEVDRVLRSAYITATR